MMLNNDKIIKTADLLTKESSGKTAHSLDIAQLENYAKEIRKIKEREEKKQQATWQPLTSEN